MGACSRCSRAPCSPKKLIPAGPISSITLRESFTWPESRPTTSAPFRSARSTRGNANAVYQVAYPIPADLLGQADGANSSGFSFGIVGFDIASSDYGSYAYVDILSEARDSNIINTTQYARLLEYRDVARYDLDPVLSQTYEADLALLNGTIFSRQEARDIIDLFNDKFIENPFVEPVK